MGHIICWLGYSLFLPSFLQGLGQLPYCPLFQPTGIPLVQDALGTAGLLHYCFWYDGACITWKVTSRWAGANLKLHFRTKPSPSHPALPDSHFLVNSLGCVINSNCFNPGIFLLVKRTKIKYILQIWVLRSVFGLCDRGWMTLEERAYRVYLNRVCLALISSSTGVPCSSVMQPLVWGEDS